MFKSLNSILILLLALVMLVSTTGCGNNTVATKDNTAKDTKDTIVITDGTGKEVTIPAKISRIVIDQIPVVGTYVMYKGGSAEGLVGMSGSVLEDISETPLVDIAPELLEVNTSFYKNGELNIEELMKLEPDVVFYKAENVEHRELFAQAGIPAVGFNTGNVDPTELYAKWLKILEDVFQEEGKMDGFISRGDETIAMVKERTATIEDSKRKNVLILINYENGPILVAGSQKQPGKYWLQAINAKNAAEEVQGHTQVNLEQLYTWKPDVIVMPGPGQCSITPSQVIANTIEGSDFSPLSAVQEKKVYTCNLGLGSWYTVNPDAPLVTIWLAQQIYPDLFKDIDLQSETVKYYKAAYNYDLSAEQLKQILSDS